MDPLTAAGATHEPTEYATLSMDRHITGLWTQRSPLRDADVPYLYGKFYSASRFDSLIDGLNREITSRLTDARRPGSSVWNSNDFPAIASYFSFKYVQGNAEIVRVIVDGQDGVIYDATANSKTTVFTKSTGAGKARFVSINSVLYFGDYIDLIKYLQGPAGWVTQNWQPAIGSVNNVVGPTIAGAGANQSGTGTAWTNPNNVTSTSSFATVNLPGLHQSSQADLCTGFGFGLAGTEQILGIQVTADIEIGSGATLDSGFSAALLRAGVPQWYDIQQVQPTQRGTLVTITFGGTSDLWGASWTPADINNANFGVAINAFSGRTGDVFSLRNVRITIYGIGGPTVTPSGVGSFAATTGFVYVFCYGNSFDKSCSTATALSANTGPFTAKDHVGVDLTASLDPQVNQIRVFRSTDGGSSAILLELPNSPFPNTTATIQDTATDTQLNAFSLAPQNNYGDPPPAGMTAPCYHMGRIFGIAGSTVVWSAGPDVLPVSANGNTAFPPANNAPFQELPIRLKSTVTNQGPTLLIYGTSNVYAIFGSGTASDPFRRPAMFMAKVGILDYDALTTVGSTDYLFTTRNKFVSLDPGAGYVEVGFPIGDQFSLVTTGGINSPLYDPANVYVTWHEQGSGDTGLYVCDGTMGWFRLSPVASPESGYLWSPRASIVNGTSAVQSVETSPGVFQLLIGPPTGGGPILYRDPTVNADWVLGTGYVNYPSWDVKGNITLCDSGEIAEIAHVGVKSNNYGGKRPVVGVMLGEIKAGVLGAVLSGVTYGIGTVSGAGSAYVAYFLVVCYFKNGIVTISPEFNNPGSIPPGGPFNIGGDRFVNVFIPSTTNLVKWRVYFVDNSSLGTPLPGTENYYVEVAGSSNSTDVKQVNAIAGTPPQVIFAQGDGMANFESLEITSPDPPDLPPSVSMYSDRYTLLQNGICPKCDNFQLKIDYGEQNTADELLKYSIYGAKHAERRQQ